MKNVMRYNNFFLIFKLCVYRSRGKEFLNVMSLVNQIMKRKKRKKTTYSEKSMLSLIKNSDNRSKTCCLVF